MSEQDKELISVLTMSREELMNKYITLKHVNSLNIESTEKLRVKYDYERERSKKLVEALEYISEWNSVELREVAEDALKEYRGKK